ncbi:MAG: hypothetical protein CMQ21_03525 [Gammaproteobacteria bacterium]|jgi:predicted CXXCH cytochrome family protein|nr:hypothetical protein [Gammaproteobacteria bacterium]MBP17945.1 hypothetical protein [Gammaproteobacteria bacterium]|tara:strand:+ start:320 stop:2608 length:2289 start_codon:yes stop_codon:yes gene_type:complete
MFAEYSLQMPRIVSQILSLWIRVRSLLWLFALCVAFCSQTIGAEIEYAGSKRCAACHPAAYRDWRTSDHYKAMSPADSETVLGDFGNVMTSFHGIESRFYTREGSYFIETLDGNGEKKEFPVSFTFGFFPLQQYLVEIGDGYMQAMNTAWDSRDRSQGGQRWIHLQPNEIISEDSPFFWTGHLQNWNSRCADCHSTNITKNFDAETFSFATTWSEINVACEACHGNGVTHIERAATRNWEQGSGLTNAPDRLRWQLLSGATTATSVGDISNRQIDMCGGCHSRRSVINKIETNLSYHDQYQLALLMEGLYFPDGQIQDEVYVLGSFLQSKMHGKGVTCTNCHNAHSGKLIANGNDLCGQCHQPLTYDRPQHHFHKPASSGAECIECHMPATTYMLVDDRRDHRFGIPEPVTNESPNACIKCHKERTNEWAVTALNQWLKRPRASDSYSVVNSLARQGDPASTRLLIDTIADSAVPPIEKATLLMHLSEFPSGIGMEASRSYLSHGDPLVRSAAVRSLRSAPPGMRWQMLKPLVDDPIKSVRYAVAVAVSDIQSEIPLNDIGVFHQVIDDYRGSLNYSIEMPSTQTEIANLALNLGNTDAAEVAYSNALLIEPNYIPALLNLADLYRALKREPEGTELLQRALAFAPESGAVNFSFGLSIIRQQKYKEALPYLKAGTEREDSQPRYGYVYAVALDSVKQTEEALVYLEKAVKRWPNQYDLLMTQVLYMEKLGKTENILVPLSALSRLAPGTPAVQQRLRQYID